MATTYTAKVQRDGALSMPKAMREKYHLREGDKVKISVIEPVAEEAKEESWADKFERELEKVWALEGERPDIPRDWGQNFDKYKPSLFSSDEEIKAS